MRSLIFAIVVSVTALAGVLLADRPIAEAGSQGRAGKATRKSSLIEIEECRIRLIDDVQLASARTGIVDMVAAEGEHVRPKQVVAKLRDELLRAGLAITERQATNDIEVRFARKASELAQLKYSRAAEAARSVAGTVSELELKELRLSAEKSLLQVEQTEQQFLVAGLRRDESAELVNTCRVIAPFEAEVLEVFKKPGEVVREGEPILRLAFGSRMKVEGYLPLAQAARVKRGALVHVRLTGEDGADVSNEVFAGRLMAIDMKVEPVSRKVKVWAELPNDNGLLRDGLTGTMSISLRETDVARREE
ncbi:MAG: HlyD family efflux transporter periplasmic adaptor subunit [Planctomycetota bacterium]|nr:HlyD family efflux transporter periplasmic adaptor subunit [Planctomycetota bacterium]